MKRLRVTGGFWVVSLWFAAVNGWRMLGVVLSAAAVHELGHMLALKLLGAEVLGLEVSLLGVKMEVDCRRLSYGGELLAVLAGPLTNFACAVVLSAMDGREMMAGVHIVLCLFNLLPVRPLDGGRALQLLVTWLAGPAWGELAAEIAGGICALLFAAMLLAVVYITGGSLWLLPPAVGMLAIARREICPLRFEQSVI